MYLDINWLYELTGAVGAFGSVNNVGYHVFEFYYVDRQMADISPCELQTPFNDDKRRPSATNHV